MAPLIKEALRQELPFFVVHSGQHYSEIMDKVFWDNLDLPEPTYNLGVGSGTHAEQVGRMMIALEPVLLKEKPDVVGVYADLNTSLAGALVAAKIGIPIVQLEAGLRSFDRSMPEEINRLVVDRLATMHFAPTPLQQEHLRREGMTKRVHVLGNLIADVVTEMAPLAKQKSDIMNRLDMKEKGFFLATIHRQSGVDVPENFKHMLTGLGRIADEYNMPVIYPIHPRSRKNVDTFGIDLPEGIRMIDPLDYIDFLMLLQNARLLLSDSGGLQEEACILHIPLVTLRENTERQETITLGANVLSGFEPDSIVKKTRMMLDRSTDWNHPYGKNVASAMLDRIKELLS